MDSVPREGLVAAVGFLGPVVWLHRRLRKLNLGHDEFAWGV